MGLEQNHAQQYREVVDKFVAPNADYQMTTRDYVVRPSSQGAGPITLTLPPVAEARGRFYSILARAASAVNTITVQDMDDSECWMGDIVLDGKCDGLLLYSDGLTWIQVAGIGKTVELATTRAPGTATATTLAPTTLQTTVAPTTAG